MMEEKSNAKNSRIERNHKAADASIERKRAMHIEQNNSRLNSTLENCPSGLGESSENIENRVGMIENENGGIPIQQDKSLEAVQLSKFLEQIKNTIDPQAHAALVEEIKGGKLNPNPFSAGIDWRNKIKEISAFQTQPQGEQENYLRGVLCQAQQTYCEVHHLPYRLDTDGRVEILPTKDRIDALLRKAEEVTKNIPEDSFDSYPRLVRACLKSMLSETPSAQKLVEDFKKAKSSQEKIAILNAIKEKDFSIDSDLPMLQNNLENKNQPTSSIARLMRLEQQRSRLAKAVFNKERLGEETSEETPEEQKGKLVENVPRLAEFQFFADPDLDHEFLDLKSQSKAALDRIKKLAPDSLLLEKIQDGTVSIDLEAITELVNTALFDEAALNGERISIEQDQADLKKQIFQYLCHDIALKFNQTYYEVAVINRDQPEILTDKKTGEQSRNPLSPLQEKLRYMTLFLEVLSRSDEKIEKNSEAIKSSAYEFLKKANHSIHHVNEALTDRPDKPPNYLLAEQNVILPDTPELDLTKVISDVPLDRDQMSEQYQTTLASMRELQRGVNSQNNIQAAYYHVRAARFLIESAYQSSISKEESAEELKQIGRAFALAGARKEWEDNPAILSQEQKHIFDEDDWSSQNYADLAASLMRKSSNLFNDSYAKGNAYPDRDMAWMCVRGANKASSYYLGNETNLFDFYRASLAERVLYNALERGKTGWPDKYHRVKHPNALYYGIERG